MQFYLYHLQKYNQSQFFRDVVRSGALPQCFSTDAQTHQVRIDFLLHLRMDRDT